MCDGWGAAQRELGANPIKGLERGAFSSDGARGGGPLVGGRRRQRARARACVCVSAPPVSGEGALEVHPTGRLSARQ